MRFEELFLFVLLVLATGCAHEQQPGQSSDRSIVPLKDSKDAATNVPVPAKEELAAITDRGRQLAAYDVAAWHATDAVMKMNPRPEDVQCYIATKETNDWRVFFGRLSETSNTFLRAFEAIQAKSPREYRVTESRPPVEVTGYLVNAARAIDICRSDFGSPSRPYNISILPATNEQMWVYFVPATTEDDVSLLGGDVRYLVSKDGDHVVEKRKLHLSVLEMKPPKSSREEKVIFGMHTALVDDKPEDTDVFYVLSRKPSMPEYVMTSNFVYRIETNGGIKCVARHKSK
jgi:hypothetical protein